jgi:prophage antirepressor-like protein
MEKEILTPEVFQFSSTKQEVRSLLVENEPWIVAKDICDILGLSNSRKSITSLDEDERTDVTISYTSSNGVVQKRKVKAVNESGLYTLIMRSNKPEAKTFRKWVTSEVLPAIRKKGYFGVRAEQKNDFVDARDIPYRSREINGFKVRFIELEGELWFSLNDVHRAIGSRTDATQAARKLNHKQTLARKIWLFGNTHPAWFVKQLGVELLASGSRILKNNQLMLNFGGAE